MNKLLLIAALAFELSMGPSPVAAQDDLTPQEVSAALDAGDDLLTEEELDALVAPVALYPDAVLTQLLVASTYPLDIVKADRLIGQNSELDQKSLAGLVEQEDWDESVLALSAGFPSLVQNMAQEVDWTEELGDAMLAQTDDLLDAVQRQRARADAAGNLESNEAQVVETVDDNISIAPADPDVVYVPSYDPVTTYTTPMTAAPVVAATDTGLSTGDILTTGAIAFGSALLIDEIFDDDDHYDDYWRGPRIDWDDAEIHPGREINVDGDVNMNFDRDGIDIDREKIGDRDLDIRNSDTAWKPDQKRKNDAKDKLSRRNEKAGAGKNAEVRDKLKAGGSNGDASGARAKLEKAQKGREPTLAAGNKNKRTGAALKPGKTSASGAKKAATRGKQSLGKAPPRAKAAPQRVSKQKSKISRPKAVKAPAPNAARKSSAFKKHSSGGRAKASKARGGKSHAKRRKRR